MPAGEQYYRISKDEYYAIRLALDGPPTEDQLGVLVNTCGVPREYAKFMSQPKVLQCFCRALGRLGARNRKAKPRYRSRNRLERPTRRPPACPARPLTAR
jgi:hypothetical protein